MTVKFLNSGNIPISISCIQIWKELDVNASLPWITPLNYQIVIFCFHFNDQLCTDFCPTVKSTSQKSARPKSALRRQKVGTVDRQDLDMTEGENLEQEFGQETASNMIDVESISSYGLDDIVNSKCGETFLCISN